MKDILDLVGRFFLSLTFVLEVYDSLKSASATKLKMTQYGITILAAYRIFCSRLVALSRQNSTARAIHLVHA